MVTTLPTNPVWWRSMHALPSYRGNRLTPPPTYQWRNQDFFHNQGQDLTFKTKTKPSFQDQDQDLSGGILEADRKAFFIFDRKRKWNSIYGRKRNENKNRHSFSAEKIKSPDNISVFFFFFIHSVTKSALQCAANTSSSFAFFAGGPCWWDFTFLMYSV